MVGVNCSIFGRSRSTRKSGVTIFKLPQGDDEWSSNWKKSIICVVTKDRVIDKALRNRIKEKNKNIFVCEKHYSEDQLIRCMCKIITFLFLQSFL